MAVTPTHQLTDKQLRFSYWYVSHKLKLRRYLIIFLIVLSCALWLYAGWLGVFYIIGIPAEQTMINRLVTTGAYIQPQIEALKPSPLQIGEVKVLGGENSRYDFISQIRNPNAQWLATFDYQFADSQNQAAIKHGFIPPGEEKYLLDLGHDEAQGKLVISNLQWQKFSNSDYVKNDKYRFTISDDRFIAGAQAGEPNRLVFNISNDSAYNYWQVGIQAFLYSGGNESAVNYIAITQLKAGEKRPVEIDWNYQLPHIDSYEIIPELNIFDNSNIMPVGQ